MTRFEKITKSPEELSKVISEIIDCPTCPVREKCKATPERYCTDSLHHWLEEPYVGSITKTDIFMETN